MSILSRWWQKYGIQLLLATSSLSFAWLLYYSKGAIISELLFYLTRNFPRIPPMQQPGLLGELEEIRFMASRLEELTAKVEELETQNQQLQKLLGYVKPQKGNFVSAPVIGRSVDGWWQLITIGIGSQEGVTQNVVVTGIGGLVGRVVEVTPNTSRVLLISDPSSRVGVTISRTRYMGFIKGNSSQTALMEFYAKVSDVQVGDVVVTSTVSSIFPPGIPIGKVISVDLNKSPAPQATIEFIAPLDFLEWVTVRL
jgi:rod shape-determining protein MreC